MISLTPHEPVHLESMGAQLLSALTKHTHLVHAPTAPSALTHLTSSPPPAAVLLTHPGAAQHEALVAALRDYVYAGGRAVVGLPALLTHLAPAQLALAPLFRTWDLRWAVPAGASECRRTTAALNPAGVPAPLRPNALFAAYSAEAVHLAHVKAKHRVYVLVPPPSPRAGGKGEGEGAGAGAGAEGCPAAWAPVGRGFVGFVGDVGAEEESARLVLEMCGVRVDPGDLGPRRCPLGVGGVATYAERGLVVRAAEEYPPRRAREEEVVVRAVRRAEVSRRKRVVAEGLKEEVWCRFAVCLIGRGLMFAVV